VPRLRVRGPPGAYADGKIANVAESYFLTTSMRLAGKRALQPGVIASAVPPAGTSPGASPQAGGRTYHRKWALGATHGL
jgi:hypothetical protein